MGRDLKQNKKVLYDLLVEFNNTKKWVYNTTELINMSCYSATYIPRALLQQGYMDINRNLLKPILDITTFIEKVRLLSLAPINGKQSTESTLTTKDYLINCSDIQLVVELRNRGYEVIAKKITEL